jgi:hypothetical protein
MVCGAGVGEWSVFSKNHLVANRRSPDFAMPTYPLDILYWQSGFLGQCASRVSGGSRVAGRNQMRVMRFCAV